jgi:RNA polymerase sigma-70 factor, ECF subfamily
MNDDNLEFQKIYETFRAKIFRYLTSLLGEYEAEDITQEVFARVSKNLSSFRGESQVSTWIYRIATNLAIDRMRDCTLPIVDRHNRAETTSIENDDEIEDRNIWTGEKPFSAEQKIIRGEMTECIRDCMEKLAEDYRAVLVLSELEGVKNSEIAEIMDVTVDTVKIRLHRARAMLRKEIERHCKVFRDERNELACEPTDNYFAEKK